MAPHTEHAAEQALQYRALRLRNITLAERQFETAAVARSRMGLSTGSDHVGADQSYPWTQGSGVRNSDMGVSEIGGGARSLGQTGEVLSRKSRLQVRFPCFTRLSSAGADVAVCTHMYSSNERERSNVWAP